MTLFSEPIEGLTENETHVLRHMVGNDGRKIPGYRSYFCASIDSDDYRVLLRLIEKGLVREGPFLDGAKERQYFYCTEKGMELGCQ
jgi:hypothetical protein